MAVRRINGFFNQEMYGCFARPKKTGGNNKVTVRWGSTVPLRRLYLHLNLYFCSSHQKTQTYLKQET